MFQRLKTSMVAWADRCQQREIQRLREEGRRLKEEVINLNGGETIPLSPEQLRLLAEKAKGIDPEVLEEISVFDRQDRNPQCPNDGSTESEQLQMSELQLAPRFHARSNSLTKRVAIET